MAGGAAALGLVAGLGACASPPAAVRLPGVSVTVMQHRSDIAPRRVELQVVNDSRKVVVVSRAALTAGGYRPELSWSGSTPAEIQPGTAVDLPAGLTTARCGAPPRPRASLTVRTKDGSATVPVRATDSHGTLAGLWRDDCFEERAARVVRFAFTALERRPAGRGVIHIRLTPGPAAADGLTVLRVLPTNLVSPSRDEEFWTLDTPVSTDGPTTIDLPAVPTRCDLHAIAEDKVGTILPFTLRLADGSVGTVNVVAPPAVKQAVTAWVSDTCAVGR